MKTEHKYSELTVFVFYIMNHFLTWKFISFNWFHNHFQSFFYSLIAKCRNIPNRPFSFFYIVSPFSTVFILSKDTLHLPSLILQSMPLSSTTWSPSHIADHPRGESLLPHRPLALVPMSSPRLPPPSQNSKVIPPPSLSDLAIHAPL
jgi:hypothetical protein